MMEKLLLLFYFLISFLFVVKLLNKKPLFGIVFTLLFLYSFFPLIAYALFPKMVIVMSGGQYYGEEYFYPFYFYLLGFLVFSFLFYNIMMKFAPKCYCKSVKFKMKNRLLFFYIVNITCVIICGFNILVNISNSSYNNQVLLKSNKIWFFLFEFLGIFILLFANKLITDYNKSKFSVNTLLLLFVNLFVFLLTAFVFGQRIQIFMVLCGLLGMILDFYHDKFKSIFRLKNIRNILLIFILALFIFQIIRGSRGFNIFSIDFGTILKNTFDSMFDMEFWVFQDWRNPALSLVTCISNNIIDPITVLRANFFNLFSFLTGRSYSITAIIKSTFDTTTSAGYGIYFATEGYMLLGSLGFLLSSFLISLYYKIYDVLFNVRNDKECRSFLMGILSFYIITLVRGYSLYFIKGIVYYLLPGIILYALYNGKIIKIRRIKC